MAGENSKGTLSAYLKALKAEFAVRKRDFSSFSRIETIFFGGGTASRLPLEALKEILSLLEESFAFLPEMEITLEGNPEDLTQSYLSGLVDLGIRRVNAGIQTFDRKILEQLGRYFDPHRYEAILETLRSFPLRRGVDLIYGFPESEEIFQSDLARVLQANLEHLSLYALTVEKGTELSRLGPYPDEDLQARLFDSLPAHLAREGYVHYEVSNYARPGFESRHNLRYWMYEPYMGLGPGAHGFTGRLRYGNPRNVDRYLVGHVMGALSPHQPAVDIWLGLLRLVRFPLAMVFEILDEADLPHEPFLGELDQLLEEGVASLDDGVFCWKARGLLFLDQYVERMISAYSFMNNPVKTGSR